MLHDLNHAAAVADRVVLLHQGRVHAVGAPADVLTTEHLTEVYGLPSTPLSTRRPAAVRIEPQGRHLHRRRLPGARTPTERNR